MASARFAASTSAATVVLDGGTLVIAVGTLRLTVPVGVMTPDELAGCDTWAEVAKAAEETPLEARLVVALPLIVDCSVATDEEMVSTVDEALLELPEDVTVSPPALAVLGPLLVKGVTEIINWPVAVLLLVATAEVAIEDSLALELSMTEPVAGPLEPAAKLEVGYVLEVGSVDVKDTSCELDRVSDK